MKILILASYPPTIISFRGELIKLFLSRGHAVTIGAPFKQYSPSFRNELKKMNINTIDFPFFRTSLNPISFLKSLLFTIKIITKLKPEYLFPYTITPVIISGITVSLMKILKINNEIKFFPLITGLGTVFTNKPLSLKENLIFKIIIYLYKISLSKANTILFQNPDDIDYFLKKSVVKESQNIRRVYGSGVNLMEYPFSNIPKKHIFLMVSRLLKDKGIYEYVNAAKRVLSERSDAKFILIGDYDLNPSSIPRYEVEHWIEKDIIEHISFTNNVSEYLEKCRYFVLPSYREGTPRSSLEALSSGRPIITTNVPGCKETVIDNYNGLIVPPKNSNELYLAMKKMISYKDREIKNMGTASRRIAEKVYDSRKVSLEYYEIIFHEK